MSKVDAQLLYSLYLHVGGTEMTQPIGGVAQCHRLGQPHRRLFAHVQRTHDTPRSEAIVVHIVHGARLLGHNLMAAEVLVAHNAAQSRVTQTFRQNGEYTQRTNRHLLLLQQHIVCGKREKDIDMIMEMNLTL